MPAHASSDNKPLRVALDRAWHPLSYFDEGNKPQGVLIDYWRLIAQKLGRPVEFQLVDWQQSLDLVRNGQADIHGGLFQSEAREQYLEFSHSLLPMSTRLFVSSRLNARHFQDLENIQVGITKGGYEVEFVEKNFPSIRLKQYSNNKKLVNKALSGEVLAFVADYPVGMYYLHKYGSPEQYQVVYTLYDSHLKSAVVKGNATLANDINTALGKITEDEKGNIFQKWIRTETVIPKWLYSSLIIIFSGIFIAGGLGYAVLLKIQVRRKTEQLQNEVDESLRLRNENIELMEELRKQKDEAEQANIAKSKFLAVASHDLRQPLHALSLFTSVLDEQIQYPRARRVVDQIRGSVQALQGLFNALLDISRLEAGVMQVEKTDFNLQELLEKLANDFTPQAQEKGLVINWPEDLYYIYSDPVLLEQILRNYISNAIRYTDSGSVTIDCKAEGSDWLTISVMDTGLGIPKNEQQAVFHEFHQVGNPERDRSKGLGLGLAIVERTARLLDHLISLDSEPGKGSVFRVRVQHSCQLDETKLSACEDARTSSPEQKSLVVVIDDEASVLEGTETLLQLWGCEVIAATEIKELIDKIRQHDQVPDAIIADYRLRNEQTGIDAINEIHAELDHDIPALIITGDTSIEHLRDVNESGYPVLHKPIAPARLHAFLNKVSLQKTRRNVGR